MAIDFGNEQEQRNKPQGPVPAGSMAMVRLETIAPDPDYSVAGLPYATRARSGLMQLRFRIVVMAGEYADYDWRQSITLPLAMQDCALSPNQETSCKIGGGILKAMLQAAGHATAINSLKEFDGLEIPVKVKLDKRPYETQSGNLYWRNEIERVLIPGDSDYARVKKEGAIINPNGAIAGSAPQDSASNGNGYGKSASPQADPALYGNGYETDDVPF